MGVLRPPVIAPRWNCASRCCRTTCPTGVPGRPPKELTVAVISWIETSFHRRRRQRGLGSMTPIDFETVAAPYAANAARPTEQPVNRSIGRLIRGGFAHAIDHQ